MKRRRVNGVTCLPNLTAHFFFLPFHSSTPLPLYDFMSEEEQEKANEVVLADASDSESDDENDASALDGDLDVATIKGKLTFVADDWKAPVKARVHAKSRHPRMRSSVKALKATVNDSNLKTYWYGKDIGGDKFWVPSRRAVDSDTMRMLASKEFPMSAVEYTDAEIFACGCLPSQYAPPKRDAIHQLHPTDLVDAEHPKSLRQYVRGKEGAEVPPWDGTVKNLVSAKLWRIRESVK